MVYSIYVYACHQLSEVKLAHQMFHIVLIIWRTSYLRYDVPVKCLTISPIILLNLMFCVLFYMCQFRFLRENNPNRTYFYTTGAIKVCIHYKNGAILHKESKWIKRHRMQDFHIWSFCPSPSTIGRLELFNILTKLNHLL